MTGGLVFVVATTGALLQAPATVEIDATPVVEIGASQTDPDDQLFRVSQVLRAADGGYLVVEASAGRIRSYGPRGAFVRDLGGLGDGPGEFRDILDVARRGDSLLVLDRDGSVTQLDLSGRAVAGYRIDVRGLTGEAFNPVPHGILDDGRVLVRAQERVFGRPDGEYVRRVGWLSVDRVGAVDTLAFLDAQMVVSDGGIPRPYRPWVDADFAAGGGTLWLSVPSEGRLVRPSDGRVLEPEAELGRPTPADLDAFRERYVERGASANDRRVIGEWLDGAPVADVLPAFRTVVVDAGGRVWVERWSDGPGRTRWDLHDPGGERMATVTIALELRLEVVESGTITGVWIDPLGVERVRTFELPASLVRPR